MIHRLGDSRAAIPLYDRAIEIREQLVNIEGRSDLIGDLAWTKASRGLALLRMGNIIEGNRTVSKALAVLNAEAVRTKRLDLKAAFDTITKQLEN